MLEGDLAELVDRRWEARLVKKNGNVRVAALVFHRDVNPWMISEGPGRPPAMLPEPRQTRQHCLRSDEEPESGSRSVIRLVHF
jgi:hypothetical protein